MNKLISEREKTDRFQITFSVDKISQQLYLHLPTESSKLVLHSGDLSHVFGADLKSNETGVWMSGINLINLNLHMMLYESTP